MIMYLKTEKVKGYAVLCEDWQTYAGLLTVMGRLLDLAANVELAFGHDMVGLEELYAFIDAIDTTSEQNAGIERALLLQNLDTKEDKQ
jgi:hypothetical protein